MRGYLDLSSGTITPPDDHGSGVSNGDPTCEQDASNDCLICERQPSTGALDGCKQEPSTGVSTRLTRGRARVLPTGDLARLIRGSEPGLPTGDLEREIRISGDVDGRERFDGQRGGRFELLGRVADGAGWWKLKVLGASVDAVQVMRALF